MSAPFTCGRCGQSWPRDPALEVECPTCHARPGAWCKRPSGHKAMHLHACRDQAAMDAGVLGRCPGSRRKPAAEPRCPCVHYELDEDNEPSCHCGHSPEEHAPECTAEPRS